LMNKVNNMVIPLFFKEYIFKLKVQITQGVCEKTH
jgi:hypothetical protein